MVLKSLSLLVVIGVISAGSDALAGGRDQTKIKAWADFRIAETDADREWLDGGYSKVRYGSKDGSGFDAEIAEIGLEWEPTFGPNWSGLLHLQSGNDQGVGLGVVEGFIRYRMLPKFGWRVSTRAGRFFPPISLEHDGPGWGLTRTLTPSAINSWVGEEVIVTGAEVRIARRISNQHLELRASLFGDNDTAGALLAYRGWAMHDVKNIAGGTFLIPDSGTRRSVFSLQANRTDPSAELDDQVGYYTFARWRHPSSLSVQVTFYDNLADPEVLENGQYGWDTRFWSVGSKFEPTPRSEFIVQAMAGSTAMGPAMRPNGRRAFDGEYTSAFGLLAYRPDDANTFSVRLEVFETEELGTNNPYWEEDGHASTIAWRGKRSDTIELGAEAVLLSHDRGISTSGSVDELQLQTMLRVQF